MTRPRRSFLFMPGSNPRAHEKGRNLPADGLILDLEDSVAPEAKALARDQIAQTLAMGGFGRRDADPHQQSRYALVDRRSRHGGQGEA